MDQFSNSGGVPAALSIDTEVKCKAECISRATCIALDFYDAGRCVLYIGQTRPLNTASSGTVTHHVLETKCDNFPTGK